MGFDNAYWGGLKEDLTYTGPSSTPRIIVRPKPAMMPIKARVNGKMVVVKHELISSNMHASFKSFTWISPSSLAAELGDRPTLRMPLEDEPI